MKPWLQRLVFSLLALAFVALAWTTVAVLRLEKEEEQAARQISGEKVIRLALERMNSRVDEFVNKENTRVIFRKGGDEIAADGVIGDKEAFVRSYFMLNPEGKLVRLDVKAQPAVSEGQESGLRPTYPGRFSHPVIRETPFLPHWQGNDLIFLKQVPTQSGAYTFAIWVDWPLLREVLLDTVKDILPQAGLAPRFSVGEEGTYSLVSLPASLAPGEIPLGNGSSSHSMSIALLLVWGLFLPSAGGLAVLLIATSRLSERRAAFVSAVTHELRTPLTNFSLYTEMLEEDLLPEEKKSDYLSLLRAESKRLIHLVENVLAYSRIEKRKGDHAFREYAVGPLFDSIVDRLREPLESRGFSLAYEVASEVSTQILCTDRVAVEQVLDNLTDNAIKYAAVSEALIRISVYGERETVFVRFTDNGPGISESARENLFVPFFRSAEEAAGQKPGVGLGLALSRDTARMLGGELRLEDTDSYGTSFVLSLPVKK